MTLSRLLVVVVACDDDGMRHRGGNGADGSGTTPPPPIGTGPSDSPDPTTHDVPWASRFERSGSSDLLQMGDGSIWGSWSGRIGEFEDSGMTVAAFAAALGVSTQRFVYWREWLRRAPAPARPRFVELAIREPESAGALEVRFPSGRATWGRCPRRPPRSPRCSFSSRLSC